MCRDRNGGCMLGSDERNRLHVHRESPLRCWRFGGERCVEFGDTTASSEFTNRAHSHPRQRIANREVDGGHCAHRSRHHRLHSYRNAGWLHVFNHGTA